MIRLPEMSGATNAPLMPATLTCEMAAKLIPAALSKVSIGDCRGCGTEIDPCTQAR